MYLMSVLATAAHGSTGGNTPRSDTLTKGIFFIMAGKLTARGIESLSRRRGRYGDGDGLFLRVLDPGRRVYWTYRYTLNGRERETSLGSFPELSLADARAKHAALRKTVVTDKSDPLAGKRNGKSAASPASSAKPTFGVMADDFVATHEGGWRNPKHRWQWTQTLTRYCAPIRGTPVDQIGTDDVLAVLKPLWTRAPVTGSRLRGRIEKIIDAARALGHIDRDRANPARWKGHLELLLPKPKKLARGHHKALAYADTPAFVQRLRSVQAGNTAALALEFLILTATRSGETLNATWDEINFDSATWTVPKERMKINAIFDVPLSDRALDILHAVEAKRGKNPFVFAGRPMRPLSNMALAMLAPADGRRFHCPRLQNLIQDVVLRCRSRRVRGRGAVPQPSRRERRCRAPTIAPECWSGDGRS
jgi:integrase-like protein/Arm domain-containing DNA-binding protein